MFTLEKKRCTRFLPSRRWRPASARLGGACVGAGREPRLRDSVRFARRWDRIRGAEPEEPEGAATRNTGRRGPEGVGVKAGCRRAHSLGLGLRVSDHSLRLGLHVCVCSTSTRPAIGTAWAAWPGSPGPVTGVAGHEKFRHRRVARASLCARALATRMFRRVDRGRAALQKERLARERLARERHRPGKAGFAASVP